MPFGGRGSAVLHHRNRQFGRRGSPRRCGHWLFAKPLGVSEIRGLARSVSRYVWRRFTPSGFRQVQAERGRLGGKASGAARLVANEDKRSSAVLMAARGMSVRAIAKELDVGKSTVARWVSHEAMSGNSADGE
ncbi:helix-turn-helix domain-containing protein [Pseudoduganella sp. FT25W]|uniref:Helix-turn-helix domain-containing protein n=1 Tax=Duganella alba TaxID=2666081 RepID=A0A6L5QDJ3_9BURK|nr:helix-turn-helix domain-containing protein [Duganella alba]MRX15144.1 helix-turn-helix domain-containing protein [Duganella alba]